MLNWCIVGSGDVVNRLVNNSLNIRGVLKVTTIITMIWCRQKHFKKINVENVLSNTKKY